MHTHTQACPVTTNFWQKKLNKATSLAPSNSGTVGNMAFVQSWSDLRLSCPLSVRIKSGDREGDSPWVATPHLNLVSECSSWGGRAVALFSSQEAGLQQAFPFQSPGEERDTSWNDPHWAMCLLCSPILFVLWLYFTLSGIFWRHNFYYTRHRWDFGYTATSAPNDKLSQSKESLWSPWCEPKAMTIAVIVFQVSRLLCCYVAIYNTYHSYLFVGSEGISVKCWIYQDTHLSYLSLPSPGQPGLTGNMLWP